jgi:N-acetylglucosaminyl-diphospho-decaprenol L-rhamnosyltransferase
MLVPRAVLYQVGLFDERYFLYSEETDLCRSIRASGWRVVYLPGAQVLHREGSSSSQASPESLYLLHRSKLQYARKHMGRLPTTLLKGSFLLRFLVTAVLRGIGGDGSASRSQLYVFSRLLGARMGTDRDTTWEPSMYRTGGRPAG